MYLFVFQIQLYTNCKPYTIKYTRVYIIEKTFSKLVNLPEKEPFRSKTKIAVSVIPSTEIQKNTFRYYDIGDPGGMTAIIGKTKEDVKKYGISGSATKIQRYTLLKRDVSVEDGKLQPKTKMGREEIKSITEREGKLRYIKNEQFVPESEYKKFQELSYFKGGKRNMPKYRKGISQQEVTGARRRGVPEAIITKMSRSQELTQREKDILNSKGLGYKVGFTKEDGTKVRSHTFSLKTKYSKRSGVKRGRSQNPTVKVKPGLPRGAYS